MLANRIWLYAMPQPWKSYFRLWADGEKDLAATKLDIAQFEKNLLKLMGQVFFVLILEAT